MKTPFLFLFLLLTVSCTDLSAPDPVLPDVRLDFRSSENDCAFVYEGTVHFGSDQVVINGQTQPLASEQMTWSIVPATEISEDGLTLTEVRIHTPGFHAWCPDELTFVHATFTGWTSTPVYSILSTDMDGILSILFEAEYLDALSTGNFKFRLTAKEKFI